MAARRVILNVESFKFYWDFDWDFCSFSKLFFATAGPHQLNLTHCWPAVPVLRGKDGGDEAVAAAQSVKECTSFIKFFNVRNITF